MVAKRKPIKKSGANQITADETIEDHAVAIARTALRPTVQAAFTLRECGRLYGNVELSGLVNALTEQTRASSDGDLTRAGDMLTAQAHTLDAIFNFLARLALNSENLDTLDRYLKLGLRAQSQCRSTWEALSSIKNPRMIGYVQQANIAHGPQQINNASAGPERAPRARGNQNPPNELLEDKDDEADEWLDTGAPQEAVEVDKDLETVASKYRPKDS